MLLLVGAGRSRTRPVGEGASSIGYHQFGHFGVHRPNSDCLGAALLDLVEAFTAQASRVGADVRLVPLAAAARVAIECLQAHGCSTLAVADDLPGREALVGELEAGRVQLANSVELWPTRRADGGVSSARLGVAETGSVLLHSSSQNRRVELCVDHHLVLLEVGRLVPTLDQAFAALRTIASQPPAYASLVSGPSRSADIERALTVGVHGPRTLTVLLLEAPP